MGLLVLCGNLWNISRELAGIWLCSINYPGFLRGQPLLKSTTSDASHIWKLLGFVHQQSLLSLAILQKFGAEVLRWTEWCAATHVTVGKAEGQVRTMDECDGRSQQENPPSRNVHGTMKSGLSMDTNSWCLSILVWNTLTVSFCLLCQSQPSLMSSI